MKKVSDERRSLMEAYVNLAFRLGKLPTRRDVRSRGISAGRIEAHWAKFAEFQEEVLANFPDMKRFTPEVAVTAIDVEHFRGQEDSRRSNRERKVTALELSQLDYLAKFAEQVFKGRIQGKKPPKKKPVTTRTQTLVLSDLHFGANIKAEETGSSDYGLAEEARRFASIIREAARYKPQYRDHTHLNVLLLGDIIENQLHDPRTGAEIAEQQARAIHLLIQGIAYLAAQFPSVTVYCATGNHGRNTARHQARAVHQKHDSYETVIYFAVKMALAGLPNVKVEIPKAPLSSFEVYGKRIGFTHGDTVIKPGNPGAAVDVKSLENQVNKLNAALPDSDEYAVIIYGHTHTGHIVFLPNGTVLLGNGSLPPPDPFAVSIGVTECANNGQWIFESVPGYPMGDQRFLKTGKQYDKDTALDNIVKPWANF